MDERRVQKQFLLSVFVFIDSLVVSALQDAGGYAISRQNNLELHLGYHTCWLSYFTLACLWCGRTAVGRCTVTWLPSFLGWVDLLTHGAPLARALRARELRYESLLSLSLSPSISLSLSKLLPPNREKEKTVHINMKISWAFTPEYKHEQSI